MIRLTEVAKDYPRSGIALAHVSFSVRKGEFVFLTGPSGSGKTTILKLLYMDDKPSQGEVWINGVSSKSASGR
ncbi:MAG TPA: ATP-binding cassette domain-containing protein, partial [Gemmatimonadaceae bacterium]